MMDDTESLRGFVHLVRRKLRLIVLVFLVCTGAGLATILFIPSQYAATALLFVDTSNKDLLDPAAPSVGTGSDGVRVDSEVELARSDAVLLRVVEGLGLQHDPRFAPEPGLFDNLRHLIGLAPTRPSHASDAQLALSRLRQAVFVTRRGLTYLLAIQVRHTDPVAAAEIANTIAESYIALQVESKVSTAQSAKALLEARMDEVRSAMIETELSIDALIDTHVATLGSTSVDPTVRQLQAQLQALEAVRMSALTEFAAASGAIERRDWTTAAAALGLDRLADAVADHTALLLADATADPIAADSSNQRRIDDLDAEIETIAAGGLAELSARIADSANREDLLRNQLRTAVLATPLPMDLLTRLYGLQQAGEVQRTQYEGMVDRITDLDLQASLQLADSRIVSPALPPTSPSGLPAMVVLGLAGMGGILIGLVTAYGVEAFVGGMVSEARAEAVLDVEAVISVPRASKLGVRSVADHVVDRPLGAFAESLRRIRVDLDRFAVDGSGGRVVMVSSLAQSDGKSSMALALARTYALAGQKTLLIDGDLRRPKLHRLVGHRPEFGLADFLAQDVALEHADAVKADPMSDVVMLLGARDALEPTDAIAAAGAFRALIENARTRYDAIVVDTAPVGVIVDGAYEVRSADALVFVARWARTRDVEAQRALEQLRRQGGRTLPVVVALNQVETQPAGYPGTSVDDFKPA